MKKTQKNHKTHRVRETVYEGVVFVPSGYLLMSKDILDCYKMGEGMILLTCSG